MIELLIITLTKGDKDYLDNLAAQNNETTSDFVLSLIKKAVFNNGLG